MSIIQRDIACQVSEAVDRSGMQKTFISNVLGISLAQLSRNLSGIRPFDLKVLDSLTALLQLKKGFFYDAYLWDCWNAPRNRGNRIKELIQHSFLTGIPEYANQMISLLLESGKELCDLYKAARDLEKQGKDEEALKLYDIVIKNERNRLVDCLALSYYRRFMIVRNWDLEHAFEAATKLGEHVTLLPGKHMYEAYLRMLTVFYVLDKWDHLLKYSGEVQEVLEGAKEYDVSLYAECLSYQEISHRHKREFDKALKVNKTYSILGDEFKKWSELNACIIFMEAGDNSAAKTLWALMEIHKEDAPNNIEHLLRFFINDKKYKDFGAALDTFSDSITVLFSRTDPLSCKRSIMVRCLIAEWLINQGKVHDAITLIVESLEQSKRLKLGNQTNECLRLSMKLFDQITTEDKDKIYSLI
ncbi:hypothetical protein ACFYU8_29885 [Brevibacillus sp. NPDC003359]|uniref:hypothetical protein n=1 Tax=unclassified Brevibacillus TaxID=2684853 RepID=UPI0036B52CAB